MIEVYIRTNCIQCKMTLSLMKAVGLTPVVVNLKDVPDLVTQFRDEGMLQAPIVITDNDQWCGFRPDEIKALSNVMPKQVGI